MNERTDVSGPVEVRAHVRVHVKGLITMLITLLLPGFMALLALLNEGELRSAYWVAAGIALLIVLYLWRLTMKPFFRSLRKPALVLNESSIAGPDGIEIPVNLVKELVLVNAHGEKVIGFAMKPGAFEQMEPDRVEQIKERPDWFMLKFGLAVAYNGYTIPGRQLLDLLVRKYNLPVRTRKKGFEDF